MLVLTRKRGESFTIYGELIKITVVDVKGGQVRIGIEAPIEIPVLRSETPDDGRYPLTKSKPSNGDDTNEN